jgi:F420H(2)-dependent quinone reductase
LMATTGDLNLAVDSQWRVTPRPGWPSPPTGALATVREAGEAYAASYRRRLPSGPVPSSEEPRCPYRAGLPGPRPTGPSALPSPRFAGDAAPGRWAMTSTPSNPDGRASGSRLLAWFGGTRAGVWTIQHVTSPLDRWLYKATGGRLLSTGRPLGPIVLLTTTGRRTGTNRTTPVFHLRDGERVVLCNVNPGFERPNPWTLNLRATPWRGCRSAPRPEPIGRVRPRQRSWSATGPSWSRSGRPTSASTNGVGDGRCSCWNRPPTSSRERPSEPERWRSPALVGSYGMAGASGGRARRVVSCGGGGLVSLGRTSMGSVASGRGEAC